MKKPKGMVLSIEIEVDVEFDVDPAEKQTRDYPGCDAEVHINSIEFVGHNLPLELFKRKELGWMKDKILEYLIDEEERAKDAAESQKCDEYMDRKRGLE